MFNQAYKLMNKKNLIIEIIILKSLVKIDCSVLLIILKYKSFLLNQSRASVQFA